MSLKVSWDEYNALVERLALQGVRVRLQVQPDHLHRARRPARRRRAVAHLRAAARDPVDALVHVGRRHDPRRAGHRRAHDDDQAAARRSRAAGRRHGRLGPHAGGGVQGVAEALPAHHRAQDRGAVVEGVFGVQARLLRRLPRRQSRGSTSRSRSTTTCARRASRRGCRPDASASSPRAWPSCERAYAWRACGRARAWRPSSSPSFLPSSPRFSPFSRRP